MLLSLIPLIIAIIPVCRSVTGTTYHLPTFVVSDATQDSFAATVYPKQAGNDGRITIAANCIKSLGCHSLITLYEYPQNKTTYNLTNLSSGTYYAVCLDWMIKDKATNKDRLSSVDCKITSTLDENNKTLPSPIPLSEVWRDGRNVMANVSYAEIPMNVSVTIGSTIKFHVADGNSGWTVITFTDVPGADRPLRLCRAWTVVTDKLSLTDREKEFGFRRVETCSSGYRIPVKREQNSAEGSDERDQKGAGCQTFPTTGIVATQILSVLMLVH